MTSKIPKVGEIYKTNSSGDLEIIYVKSDTEITIRFVDTGTVKVARGGNIRGGKVLDLDAKRICGVGVVGYGIYTPKGYPNAYSVWSGMLRRCYTPDKGYIERRYKGRGVYVCEEWLNFQNYAGWHEGNYVEEMQLDKDIIKLGNKLYCPEFCRFVPKDINTLFSTSCNTRGDYPCGVYKDKRRKNKPFSVIISCKNKGDKKRKFSGNYSTPEIAFSAYREAKLEIIEEKAKLYFDEGTITQEIYDALLRYEVVPYPK